MHFLTFDLAVTKQLRVDTVLSSLYVVSLNGSFIQELTRLQLCSLSSLRCIHMPQMSRHQQEPISPKMGKVLYKGLQTPPSQQSLLGHGTCPCMCCSQFGRHILDVVLILQSEIFSLQHQVGDKQLLKMFRLQIHKEITGSLILNHPHFLS